MSTTSNSTNGASLNLGSVTSALGVGGAVGQIANGIGLGSSSSVAVSKTYLENRFIIIPPNSHAYLSQNKWVETKNASLLSSADYEQIEHAEEFDVDVMCPSEDLTNGEIRIFSEEDSVDRQKFIITYSSDDMFMTYSTVEFEIFIREMIGCGDWNLWRADLSGFIEGTDQYSIIGTALLMSTKEQQKSRNKK